MKYLNKYEMFNEAVNFFEKGKFWLINGKKVKVVGSIPQNPQVLKFQEVDETGKPVGKPFVGKKGEVKGWKQTKTEESPKGKFKVGDKAYYKNRVVIGYENSKLKNDTEVEIVEIKGNKAKIKNSATPDGSFPKDFIIWNKFSDKWDNFVELDRLKTLEEIKDELKSNKSSEVVEKPVESTDEIKPEVKNRYKELLTTWKENQKKLGKNESPGEGTRARLMKQAQSEINFDETKDVDVDLKKLKKTTAYDAVDRLSSLVKGQKVKKPENVIKYLDFIKSKINAGNVAKPSLN